MEIIDAQIHTWLSDRPQRPWLPNYRAQHWSKPTYLLHAGQTNTTEMALTEMATAGVDRALLTPIGVYGTINTYELEGAAKYPTRFRVVGWIDYLADDVEDQVAADVARGMVGVRIPDLREQERHERAEFDRVLNACEKQGLVVALMVSHPMAAGLRPILQRYEGIRFVIGHLGVGFAPPVLGELPPDPFVNLPAILDLAKLPNVHVNVTGAPSLSRELFPFRDVWDGVLRILEAFGPDRVMWGSDYTRTAGLYSYWDGANYLREIPGLSGDDLSGIYGANLRRVYNWDGVDPAATVTAS